MQQESITYATITLQNYFRMYEKLSGMTGTAMTESEELMRIYRLDVIVISAEHGTRARGPHSPHLSVAAGQVAGHRERDQGDQ